MGFIYPDNVLFECNRCALCCGDTKEKTRHVLLLKCETKTISSETFLPTSVFAIEISDNVPYSYELKKNNEGKCFFLRDNKCSIYAVRPLICRFYPFELKFSVEKDKHVFSFTLECPGISQGKKMGQKDFEALFDLANKRLT